MESRAVWGTKMIPGADVRGLSARRWSPRRPAGLQWKRHTYEASRESEVAATYSKVVCSNTLAS